MKKSLKIKIKMNPYEIFNTIILLIIAVLFFIVVCWMGGKLIGAGGLSYDVYFGKYKPMIVVSESMTPLIAVNSVVLIEDRPYEDIEIGDIILFNTDRYGLICHRVVGKTGGIFTKGDHNQTVDYWTVSKEMYKGSVYKIHNEYAGFITFLFGDLNNISIFRLFFGYLFLVFMLIGIINLGIWVYRYVFVFFFLRKASRLGGKNTVELYYPYVKDEKMKNNLIFIFDDFGRQRKIKGKIFVRYEIMRLDNAVKLSERARKRFNKRYESVERSLKK